MSQQLLNKKKNLKKKQKKKISMIIYLQISQVKKVYKERVWFGSISSIIFLSPIKTKIWKAATNKPVPLNK